MTEVVTASAALSQLNLLASRQQAFVVDRQTDDSAITNVDSSSVSGHPGQAVKTLNLADQGASAGHHDAPQQHAAQPQGPSRPRVEIRSLDVGLTPSEVVGTPDILQRFDENGDGRVDLLEAEKATLVRQKVFTFAGLATAPHKESSQQRPPIVAIADQPAAPGTPTKLYVAPDTTNTTVPKKLYADAAEAAAGVPTATADVPKKFYGQGVEVVAGPVVASAEAPKISDKIVAKDQIVPQAGTGEVSRPDKVSQVDTDQTPDQPAPDDGRGKLFEKAQEVVAALHGGKKTVVVEVNAYAAANVPVAAPSATVTA